MKTRNEFIKRTHMCPNCDSDNTELTDPYLNGCRIERRCACMICGMTWVTIYNASRYIITSKPKITVDANL